MLLHVRVHPRAHHTAIRAWDGSVLHINVRATPKENEANVELLRFLSGLLHVPKTRLSIVKGWRGRVKLVALPEGTSLTPLNLPQ